MTQGIANVLYWQGLMFCANSEWQASTMSWLREFWLVHRCIYVWFQYMYLDVLLLNSCHSTALLDGEDYMVWLKEGRPQRHAPTLGTQTG